MCLTRPTAYSSVFSLAICRKDSRSSKLNLSLNYYQTLMWLWLPFKTNQHPVSSQISKTASLFQSTTSISLLWDNGCNRDLSSFDELLCYVALWYYIKTFYWDISVYHANLHTLYFWISYNSVLNFNSSF